MKTPEQIVSAIEEQMLKEAGIPPEHIAAKLGTSFVHRLACDIVASESGYLMVWGGKAIMCLKCSAVSHNPNDVEQRYCGACHEFLDQPETAEEA